MHTFFCVLNYSFVLTCFFFFHFDLLLLLLLPSFSKTATPMQSVKKVLNAFIDRTERTCPFLAAMVLALMVSDKLLC